MVRSATRSPKRQDPAPAPRGERRRGVALGALTGTIGLGCCVYPAALALAGLSSASAAAALGNRLYDEWGWAFKGAAGAFAVAAVLVQKRRADACPVDARPNVKRTALWLVATGTATYGLLYAGTKALERFA